jgi:hypothetical protein
MCEKNNDAEKNTNFQGKNFSISYINKNESIFLLGLIRPISCTHCPDFYVGCAGSPGFADQAGISDYDYISNHNAGTEGFLCGKLRNIINLNKADELDIQNKFEIDFNKRVSCLAKKEDNSNNDKYVLISDKEELNETIEKIEQTIVEKVNEEIEQVNQENNEIINMLKEHINEQEETIKTMQQQLAKQNSLITQLKRKKKKGV